MDGYYRITFANRYRVINEAWVFPENLSAELPGLLLAQMRGEIWNIRVSIPSDEDKS